MMMAEYYRESGEPWRFQKEALYNSVWLEWEKMWKEHSNADDGILEALRWRQKRKCVFETRNLTDDGRISFGFHSIYWCMMTIKGMKWKFCLNLMKFQRFAWVLGVRYQKLHKHCMSVFINWTFFICIPSHMWIPQPTLYWKVLKWIQFQANHIGYRITIQRYLSIILNDASNEKNISGFEQPTNHTNIN